MPGAKLDTIEPLIISEDKPWDATYTKLPRYPREVLSFFETHSVRTAFLNYNAITFFMKSVTNKYIPIKMALDPMQLTLIPENIYYMIQQSWL